MSTVRDLGRIDPWQESLERSLARRGKSTRRRTAPGPAPRPRPRPRPRRTAKHSKFLILTAACVGGFAFLTTTLANVVSGRGAKGATAASARVFPVTAGPQRARSGDLGIPSTAAPQRRPRTCRALDSSGTYVNPLAGAHVTSERVDQGIDYAGTGTLGALGPATITYVGTTGTGWPGAFIEYELAAGPDAGCYVYNAEGVIPVPGLHIGQAVRAGQQIARIIPGWATGIELGWGSGDSTKSSALKDREWTARDDAHSIASKPGKSFSALIQALGGPGGRIEG